MILDLSSQIGDINADPTPKGQRLIRLQGDLAGDLSIVGEHDRAVEIAQRLASRDEGAAAQALHRSNLASSLLQRAASQRIASDVEAAASDLGAAQEAIDRSLKLHDELSAPDAYPHREARAIALSIAVERGTLNGHLEPEVGESLRVLLRESFEARPWEETYLQNAYRIGRFGMVYLLQARSHAATERAVAYLQLAWDMFGNALVRPWLPIALHDALIAADHIDRARELAVQAGERLEIQCGPRSPATILLRSRTNPGELGESY